MPGLGRAILLPVSVLMLATACSSNTTPGSVESASAVAEDPSSGMNEGPRTWMMTGLPIPADRSLRTILSVKVDNTATGKPQMGINRADLVVQGPVEGGSTRLAVFFESKSPRIVGPVRSIRTSDVGVAKPAEAVVVASGGAPIALNAMTKANITVHAEGSAGLYRDPARPAPYNLFANLATVRGSIAGEAPQKAYLAFGAFTSPDGVAAQDVAVTFSSQSREEWTYSKKAGSWKRSGQSAGGNFSARNLLMLRVRLRDAGYRDPAGNFVPEVVTTGSGKGYLAVGQKAQRIRWSKRSALARWEITTLSGSRIELPPGKSWISLIPKTTGGIEYR